jgi:hypothetical protein
MARTRTSGRAWAVRLAAVGFGIGASTLVTFAKDDAAKTDAPKVDPPKAAAAAAEPKELVQLENALTDKEKADGWKLLFDGKSADGWRNYNKDAVSDKWQVKDGVLELTGKGGGDLITKDQYESYELVLDYKISEGGNSGLIFHVQEAKGKPPYDSGPEIQIQDNVKGHDPQLAGWLYQLYQPPVDEKTGKPIDATKPAGEWNQLRFVLDGGKGTVSMNGVKYESFEIGSDDWNQRLAKSKFAKWERFAKATKGHVCLQDHGNQVAFRNIKIRTIAAK